MNLILLEPREVSPAGLVTLRDARARHLRDVLKISPAQSVRVGIINGPPGVGTVTSLDADAARLTCTFEPHTPTCPRVDLLLALPRPKVMRRLWAQLAAIGVGRIILTNAEKVERDYFGTHLLEPEVYRPLLIEGLQQARDTRLPLVSIHRQFRPLVEDQLDGLSDTTTRLVAHPDGDDVARTGPAGLVLSDPARGRPTGRVLLAVGPEGGWNDFELRLLEARGFQRIGLGPRTLRTDTACIALLSLVHAALR